MNGRERLLQLLMAFVAFFHLAVGVGLNVSPQFVPWMADLYGAKVETWSPQFMYILRPLGAFMLVLGLIAAATALQPRQYRFVIYAFAALFTIRALHRVFDSREITDVFGISTERNITNMAFFFGLAASLVLADLWSHRPQSAAAVR